MNPEPPLSTPLDLPDPEARITAYILGELSPEEAAACREALAQDPALEALHQQLRKAITLVQEHSSGLVLQVQASAPAGSPAPGKEDAQEQGLKLAADRRARLMEQLAVASPSAPSAPSTDAKPGNIISAEAEIQPQPSGRNLQFAAQNDSAANSDADSKAPGTHANRQRPWYVDLALAAALVGLLSTPLLDEGFSPSFGLFEATTAGTKAQRSFGLENAAGPREELEAMTTDADSAKKLPEVASEVDSEAPAAGQATVDFSTAQTAARSKVAELDVKPGAAANTLQLGRPMGSVAAPTPVPAPLLAPNSAPAAALDAIASAAEQPQPARKPAQTGVSTLGLADEKSVRRRLSKAETLSIKRLSEGADAVTINKGAASMPMPAPAPVAEVPAIMPAAPAPAPAAPGVAGDPRMMMRYGLTPSKKEAAKADANAMSRLQEKAGKDVALAFPEEKLRSVLQPAPVVNPTWNFDDTAAANRGVNKGGATFGGFVAGNPNASGGRGGGGGGGAGFGGGSFNSGAAQPVGQVQDQFLAWNAQQAPQLDTAGRPSADTATKTRAYTATAETKERVEFFDRDAGVALARPEMLADLSQAGAVSGRVNVAPAYEARSDAPILGDTPTLGAMFKQRKQPVNGPASERESLKRKVEIQSAEGIAAANTHASSEAAPAVLGVELKQLAAEPQLMTNRAAGALVVTDTIVNSVDKQAADRLEPAITQAVQPAAAPQPEFATAENAFSTFSLNVTDVSFKLAAASLEQNTMPDPLTIRSEEFVNAFDYRDPEPPAGSRVGLSWERAAYPFAHRRDLLRLSLKTAARGRATSQPLNLVILLDNSGSMERADRVQILHEALRVLAEQLQPQDMVSVVAFARTARLWVDALPGSQASELVDRVGSLTPEGGTNLEDALKTAYQAATRHFLAQGNNRVVLLTDGAANLGDASPDSLKAIVETQRKAGIALDCFGVGWEGYNDDLLALLSSHGDGRYGFLNSPEEAANDFAGQLVGALQIAASDVKVQVEFNPKRVPNYRQIGYTKHQLTKEQFRDNTVDAAELGAAEAGNALYTMEIDPAGEGPLGWVRARFRIPGTQDYREQEWVLNYTGPSPTLDHAAPTLRLAAAAAAFAEWLASSPFAGEVTPDLLLRYLGDAPGSFGVDPRPRKLEAMIRQAKSIRER